LDSVLFNPFNVATVLTIAEITISVKHPNLLPARYRKIRVKVAEHRAPGGAMKPAEQPFRARPSGDGEARGGIT